MQLSEIYAIFRETSASDWLYVPCHSGSGPAYVDDWTIWNEGRETWGLGLKQHPHRATYRGNVALTIAFGMEEDRSESYDWANEHFPSMVTTKGSVVDLERIDIFWNGALVDRKSYYALPDARRWLPAFNSHDESESSDPERSVSETDVRLLELLYQLEIEHTRIGYRPIRESLARVGVTILDENP